MNFLGGLKEWEREEEGEKVSLKLFLLRPRVLVGGTSREGER